MLSAGARRRCEKGQLDAHVPFQHIATAPHRSRASGDMQRQTCAWHDGCLSRSNGASGTTAPLTVTLLGMTCLVGIEAPGAANAGHELRLACRQGSWRERVETLSDLLNSRRFLDCWDAAQLCWEAFSCLFRVEQAELSVKDVQPRALMKHTSASSVPHPTLKWCQEPADPQCCECSAVVLVTL